MNAERTFEESLKLLEKIVEKLEDQNTSLEDAMNLFKEGVTLSEECAKKLENAKQSVYSLIEKDGKMEKVEFINDDE